MTTTKRFKEVHNLSDRTFSRLVAKIQEDHPGVVLTERRGSRDWEILHLEIFENYVKQPVTDTYQGFQQSPQPPATPSFQASGSNSLLNLAILPYTPHAPAELAVMETRPMSLSTSDLNAEVLALTAQNGQMLEMAAAIINSIKSGCEANLTANATALAQERAAAEALEYSLMEAQAMLTAQRNEQARINAERLIVGKRRGQGAENLAEVYKSASQLVS